jgi:hypothetical protein
LPGRHHPLLGCPQKKWFGDFLPKYACSPDVYFRKALIHIDRRPVGVAARRPSGRSADDDEARTRPRTFPGPSHNRPHTLRQPCQDG